MSVDGRAVFDYARRYAERSERAGRGTEWPTLREAARRFRCRIGDISDAVEGTYIGGDVYFGIAVGAGVSGVGHAVFDNEGDCLIEAYGEPT